MLSAPTDAQLDTSRLQRAVDRAVDESHAAIVVIALEPETILASSHLEAASKALVRPGSAVKPLVLAELVNVGKVDPKQHLVCKRPLRIGSMRLDCSHPSELNQIDADDAIAYSCNSYVSQVALRMSADELVQTFRRAGLDSTTGLVKSEAAGRIQMPTNQEQLQLAALGERGIEVTPLELLHAFRNLALRRAAGSHSPEEAVFAGMEHAVSYGTAHAAYVSGMDVAGKTGTAASARTAHTHGLFVGYAPAERPEIGIVVYVPQGRGPDAAALAQPVFEEFSRMKRKP